MRWLAIALLLGIRVMAVAQEVAPPLFTFSHVGGIREAHLSPDETRLATVGLNSTLKLWDLTSGELLAEPDPSRTYGEIIWLEDSTRFIAHAGSRDCAGCLQNAVLILSADGDLQTVIEQEENIGFVQLGPDQTRLLLLLVGSVAIYDLNGELVQTLPFDNVSVPSIHWYADDSVLLHQWEDNGGFTIVWDTADEVEILRVADSDISGEVWQSNNSGLISVSMTVDEVPIVWLFDAGGQLVEVLNYHPAISSGDSYTGDDPYFLLLDNPQLASDTSSGVAIILDRMGREIARISDDDYIDTALWNGDQTRLLLSAQGDRAISVWTPFGELIYSLPFEDYVRGALWSDDSVYILGWSYDHTVRTFTASDGGLYRVYPMDGLPETAMFNSDQSRILARTGLYPFDGTQTLTGAHEARLWSLDRDLLGIYPHEARMLGAAWNAGESRILTWSEDGVVKVWIVPAS